MKNGDFLTIFLWGIFQLSIIAGPVNNNVIPFSHWCSMQSSCFLSATGRAVQKLLVNFSLFSRVAHLPPLIYLFIFCSFLHPKFSHTPHTHGKKTNASQTTTCVINKSISTEKHFPFSCTYFTNGNQHKTRTPISTKAQMYWTCRSPSLVTHCILETSLCLFLCLSHRRELGFKVPFHNNNDYYMAIFWYCY